VGADTISYAEAYERALRWAAHLLGLSEGPPRAIGVLADRGSTAYLGILAAMFTGAAVVPIQPDLPGARIGYMLQASGAEAVLADQAGAAVVSELDLAIPLLNVDRVSGRPGPDGSSPVARVRPDDVAYILFTSGSTGRPKGVPITHRNLDFYFRLLEARYDFAAGDVFSQILQLNFDCSVFELFAAWGAGATVCHVPAFAYRDMPSFLTEQGMTVWFSTPSAINFIRRTSGLPAASMPTLRWSFFAGEALRCSDLADWQAAACRGHAENLYGPTELTLTITGHRWSPELSPGLAVNGIVPIGTLHPGHEFLLLSGDGAIVPDEGELCVTGQQMSPGYLNPADNAGRFLLHDSRTWYRTGDRARLLPGGELAYLGRLDSQVQIRGLRVELAEIDHAVRSCAGVQDAVTVVRSTDDDSELVVFYTGSPASPVALARQLRAILPAEMIPRVFRHIEQFPLNPNKKIDKLRLANLAAGS
jgi:amino acid adenylation domain-containing protein